MPDDRRDRHHRRTPAAGYPVHVDPELTPPPQEMPRPESRDGYDSIAPPIREQLTALADGLGQVTHAVGKIWDARNDGTRLDRIDDKLAAVAAMLTRHQTILDDNLIPQLDRWRATTDELAAQLPRISAALEGLSLMVSAIDNQQRRLELEVRTDAARTEKTLAGLAVEVATLHSTTAGHDDRITALELDKRDARVGATAISRREKKLIAGAGAAITVVGFVAAKWAAIVAWFTR